MNSVITNTELSSHEGTRCQFNGGRCAIKSAEGRIRPVYGLGIDVHQDFYVVVMQEGGANPKPPQRFAKAAFLHWAAYADSQANPNARTTKPIAPNPAWITIPAHVLRRRWTT